MPLFFLNIGADSANGHKFAVSEQAHRMNLLGKVSSDYKLWVK